MNKNKKLPISKVTVTIPLVSHFGANPFTSSFISLTNPCIDTSINTKMNQPLTQAGFTLIEIMIAVLIFGILMLTIFSSFRSFVLSSSMINGHIEQCEKADMLMNRVIIDLQALRIALPPEYAKPDSSSRSQISTSVSYDNEMDPFRFLGGESSVNGVSFSTLSFTSLAHISFGQDTRTGVARIGYYVRPNSDNGFDLCRSDTLDLSNRAGSEESSDCDPVICRNITEFVLTYNHVDGDEYTQWDSESDEFGYTTPISIHIAVAFKTGKTGQGDSIENRRYRENNESGEGGHSAGVRRVETSIEMPLFRGK